MVISSAKLRTLTGNPMGVESLLNPVFKVLQFMANVYWPTFSGGKIVPLSFQFVDLQYV